MQQKSLLTFLAALLVMSCGMGGTPARAATPFAISAANLTMPSYNPPTTSDGVTTVHLGSSQFTVTGIPAAGTLTISCQYAGTQTEAKIPQYCGPVGSGSSSVDSVQTVSGTVYFVPYGQAPPPSLGQLHRAPNPAGRMPLAGMALAGALLLGFGFRRRARSGLFLAIFAACALAGAAGISACGEGNGNAMTPGTYSYTISAGFTETGSSAMQTATTNITLTVQ